MTSATTHEYDAIVVGARCAGSSTAMLLARRGYRVLLVDRARFPSDTVSTHLIHPPGVAALRRWGLLNRLTDTGCPPVTRYTFDFGPFVLSGTPPPTSGAANGTGSTAYCPRRSVLDKLLVDAAAEAGAEVREGFTVHDLVVEDGHVVGIRGGSGTGSSGRTPVTARARVVIGADGAHSRVADAVRATTYDEKPMYAVAYYAYWSGFPVEDAAWMVRPNRGYGAFPTHDGLTMVLAAWPRAELQQVKLDVEGAYLQALRQAYGDRMADARREERVVGSGTVNYFHTPYGPGWALVGDAGYLKDAVTAQGMTDAFLDAELLTTALHGVWADGRPWGDAMADYQRRRDERVKPMYDFTTQLATLAPPPPEMQQLLAGMAGNQAAMDQFVGVWSGTLPASAFFDPSPIRGQ